MTGALSAIFWGLLILSVLVFIHEGGHFLAARAFGKRVTEFFLGMPSRAQISWQNPNFGTRFGVTPLLLGGYTRICGMEGNPDELLADCLAIVMQEGTVEAAEVARRLQVDEDRAYAMLATLSDWASVQPVYDAERGEQEGQAEWPSQFSTVRRDAQLLTIYDSEHDFAGDGVLEAGSPQPFAGSASEFLAQERSRTYLGASFPQRIVMLLAGPLVNILFSMLLIVFSLSVVGVDVVVDTNVLGDVTQGSFAEAAGLGPGDALVAINGVETPDFTAIREQLDVVLPAGEDFEISYERDGKTSTAIVDLDGPTEMFGVVCGTERMHLGPVEAVSYSVEYARQVLAFAASILNPAQIKNTLDASSSVVGISRMASEAAASGFATLMMLAASVSMSLGFMNLLPIPPLDGGKIVIEVIQLALGRDLSTRVQTAISYIGLAFFMLIFVYVLRQDILRILAG